MLRITQLAVALCLIGLLCSSVWAQASDEEKTFSLHHALSDSTALLAEEAETEVYVPGIRAGQLETSFTLGFMNLDTTLLSAEQILYKFTEEAVYWGDVELVGESSFNPVLRFNYNLTSWFALEPVFSISVSEYNAKITRRHRQANEDEAPIENNPPLEEFDPEHRSIITLGTGMNAILYPLNLDGDGDGRWHPFLLGHVGQVWFDLNSSYTEDTASNSNLGGGVGIRFITDELISVRFQVAYHATEAEFTPANAFDTLNEGTIEIPVAQNLDGTWRVLDTFEPQTINVLSWAIGFTANF